jgi:hypothetical protein
MDRLLRGALAHIRRGNLVMTSAKGTVMRFGDGTGPPISVRFTTEAAQWRRIRSGARVPPVPPTRGFANTSSPADGFRYFGLMVFQVQLARRQDAVPLTRDYLADAESRLRALDRADRTRLRLAGE